MHVVPSACSANPWDVDADRRRQGGRPRRPAAHKRPAATPCQLARVVSTPQPQPQPCTSFTRAGPGHNPLPSGEAAGRRSCNDVLHCAAPGCPPPARPGRTARRPAGCTRRPRPSGPAVPQPAGAGAAVRNGYACRMHMHMPHATQRVACTHSSPKQRGPLLPFTHYCAAIAHVLHVGRPSQPRACMHSCATPHFCHHKLVLTRCEPWPYISAAATLPTRQHAGWALFQ